MLLINNDIRDVLIDAHQSKRPPSDAALHVEQRAWHSGVGNALSTLTFDAYQRAQARNLARESGTLRDSHDRAHILVGARRLFSDTARRGTADQDSLRSELIDDLAAAPLPERRMAGHRASGAVASRGKRLVLAR